MRGPPRPVPGRTTAAAETAGRPPIRSSRSPPTRSAPRWPRSGRAGGSTTPPCSPRSPWTSRPRRRWSPTAGRPGRAPGPPGHRARPRSHGDRGGGRRCPAGRWSSGPSATTCARPSSSTTPTGPSSPCKADPEWQEAMRAPGHHRLRQGADRPVAHRQLRQRHRGGSPDRPLPLLLPGGPADNGYARPIEGVLATVDAARGVVLDVLDYGVVPLPPRTAAATSPRTTSRCAPTSRPLEIVQPDGVSFTLDGNLLAWQRWSMRVSMDPHEGLVLHTVGYDDGGRIRPDPAPGLRSARWSSPTATRARCTAGRTPSTSASGASAAWPTR